MNTNVQGNVRGGRKYEKRRRAETEAETRARIVEAAVTLHGTLGPARTTISAIAERAGVQRLTVYRHFPDERALFRACTSHYRSQHSPPDPSLWSSMAEPIARLERALTAQYAFYREVQPMWDLGLRDAAELPALAEALAPDVQALAELPDLLLPGWTAAEPALLRAALVHALDFRTWRSLVLEQDLSDAAAVALMRGMVQGVALSDSTRVGEAGGGV